MYVVKTSVETIFPYDTKLKNCKTVKKNVNIMKSCKVWTKYEIQGILLLWWRIIQF